MKIIVATDGSEFSRAAVEECCRLIVNPKETKIKVVSVYPAVLPLDEFPDSLNYAEKQQEVEQQNAKKYVNQAQKILLKHFPDLEIATETLNGSTDHQLIECARQWKAELIIVGSHGRGFWGRLIIGSVADSLVHHSPCSVLIVRKSES